MNGSIRTRSTGTWQIRYEAPPDGSGKRKYLSKTIRGNKKDAERTMREIATSIDNGGFVSPEKETVANFMHRWLKDYVATTKKPKTLQGYEGNINRYILPAFGWLKLQELTGRHIQALYGELTGRGLSNTSVVQVHRIIHKALSLAVKWGCVTRNVADAASPPKVEQKTMETWEVETVRKFLGSAKENRYGDLYVFGILTGLRRGELCGLLWKNVDLQRHRISIVQTLQRITGRGLVVGKPKTKRSRRSIALGATEIELLHTIRGKQIERQVACGDLWASSGYVFTQADGNPIDPDLLSKDFPKFLRKAGLPHLQLHGLRHCNASLLLSEGIHLKVVSERLGHQSISITADLYSHVSPGLQEEAASVVGNLLSSPE